MKFLDTYDNGISGIDYFLNTITMPNTQAITTLGLYTPVCSHSYSTVPGFSHHSHGTDIVLHKPENSLTVQKRET